LAIKKFDGNFKSLWSFFVSIHSMIQGYYFNQTNILKKNTHRRVCWFSRFFKIDPHHAVYYSIELCYMLWVACVFGSKSTDS